MADDGKRNIEKPCFFRLAGETKHPAVYSQLRSKERFRNPTPMCEQAGLPYCALRPPHDEMGRRYLMDRIVFELPADLDGVGLRFLERIARLDKGKTKVDNARESVDPNRGHLSYFATRKAKTTGHE